MCGPCLILIQTNQLKKRKEITRQLVKLEYQLDIDIEERQFYLSSYLSEMSMCIGDNQRK